MKKFWKTVGKVVAFPVTGPVRLVRKSLEKTTMSAVGSIVRHLLTAAAGAGFVVTDEMVAQFTSAVVFLAGVIWSIANHRRQAGKS